MKRARLSLVALTLALGFVTAVYAGSTSTTLRVVANVPATVEVSTTTLNFGEIDPAVSSTASAFIIVTAPTQQPYTIALGGGSGAPPAPPPPTSSSTRRMFGSGGSIPYKLFQPDQTTEWGDNGFGNTYPAGSPLNATGTGSPQSHSVHGMTQPTQSPLTPGGFSDQVQVTVHF